MKLKKTFERVKLVMVNIVKQVLGQLLTLVLSVLVFKMHSKELWGGFAAYFVYVNLIAAIISWGNKEFLIREFSKSPGKIPSLFYRVFNPRLLLLALAMVAVLFVFPKPYFGFFALWISSLYISQSLEVFWIYKRDYIKSILIEIIAFALLLAMLYSDKIDSGKLIGYYAYYQLARTVLYAAIYIPELKKFSFSFDKSYFSASFSFFLLSLVGFLQSRADLVIITFFESDKNIAVYQILTAFLILIHALGTFLIFPYMKNIYRLQQNSVYIFQRFISFIAPLLVCFCLAVLFLVMHYVYEISLDYQYYILGVLVTFPPYLYTVKILILYKENKQAFVLKTGILAIIINSIVSALLLYLGYGLKGALLGSAIAHIFTAWRYLAHFSTHPKEIKTKQQHINKQNIGYYNKIAADYDVLLDQGSDSGFMRQKVAGKLTSVLQQGIVLDFGGGTGADLKWLLENRYTVVFCEPSPGMRKLAMERFGGPKITFLKDAQVDFTTWETALPFEPKAAGVIANFAVLNCISDLTQLFKSLDLVTAPKAEIVVLVLDYSLKQKLKINFAKTLKSVITQKAMHVKLNFDGERQWVYLHSLESIKKAAGGYFEINSCEKLKGQGFLLIHLTKK